MKKWLILLVGILTLSLVFTGCGVKGATYNYDLNNYVTIGQYKGIEVSKEEIETNMQTTIDELINGHSTEETATEGTVEIGDTVNITYAGKMNGELFDGGSASAVDLQIGSNSFIPGFEEGLVGKKLGETVNLDLQFPENYSPNPDLSEASVVFEVTIHSKKITVLPDYNDEFIAGLTNIAFDTVEAYEANVRLSAKKALAWNEVMMLSTVKEYPKAEMKFYYDMVVTQYENMAMSQYGMSLETFIVQSGTTNEEFLTAMLNTAKKQVQQDMVTYLIADLENITAAGSDYDELALKFANNNGFSTVKAYKDMYGQAEINRSILLEKLVDLIAAEAVEV
jgi:FKBP-type peptidyl-prolyl cis-trans isomerase (trigger factor)